MQTIQASEAKTHFLRILDEVERGESIVITRHGKPVARISPQVEVDREKVKQADAGRCVSCGKRQASFLSKRFSLPATRAAPDAVCARCFHLGGMGASPMRSSQVAEAAEERLRDDHALVPGIWWYEIRSILIVNERRTAHHSR